MPQLTITFGVGLILVGVGVYFGTGRESVTALIPAIAGIPMLLAGLAATRPEWYRYGLYAAVALAAILALGTLRGVTALIDGDVTTGSIVNTGLLIVSVVFLAVVVSSLRSDARHQRAD